jgi:hypothetical protein
MARPPMLEGARRPGELLCHGRVRLAHGVLPRWRAVPRHRKRKKAGVEGDHKVSHHAGLLIDRPPGLAGLPLS